MNERDSETVAAQLANAGHVIVDNEHDADVIILNTCSVREQAEIKAIGKSGHLVRKKHENPVFKIGIIGCMAENFGSKLFEINSGIDFVVGPRRIHEVVNIINDDKKNIFVGDGVQISQSDNFDHDFSKKKCTAYVSIMQGCCMKCSYCIVPKTRGEERSRNMDDIVEEVECLVENGIKEVTLLGQIVNNFGEKPAHVIDGKRPFVQLLERLNCIDGLERMRYMSPHPSFFTDDLINAHASLKKLCPSVHLPVQSGSNRILRDMRRPYTREKIIQITNALRGAVPDIGISTDIIVGYPTETEDDFQSTVSLFDDAMFNMGFIFKYSPRAGTKSSEMTDDVSECEKNRRNKILLKRVAEMSLFYNRKFVNQTVDVLVEGRAKRGNNTMFGWTPNHYKVLFSANDDDIGKILKIKINDFTTTALIGEVTKTGDFANAK